MKLFIGHISFSDLFIPHILYLVGLIYGLWLYIWPESEKRQILLIESFFRIIFIYIIHYAILKYFGLFGLIITFILGI